MHLRKLVGISTITAILFAVGCGAAQKAQVIPESQLGYGDQGTPPKVEYTKAAPGTSQRFERSYQNAPPMIPHSVEGMLPITIKNNACLGCHMPSVAKSMGATPIPPTHFKDFFFETKKKLIKQGIYEDTATYKARLAKLAKKEDIAPQRYNCSQCHAPQANAKPLVANTFKPDYKNPEAKHKSFLNKELMEGVQ